MFPLANEKGLEIKTGDKNNFFQRLFPTIIIFGVLIVYVVLFFSKVNNPHWIFAGDTLSNISSYSYHFSGIARGEYPLWNPLARSGESDDIAHMILLANPILNSITMISAFSSVGDIVFSFSVYLFTSWIIYVFGVYILVTCWSQNHFAGVFASVLALGSSSVFFSEFYPQFIQIVCTMPWLLFALTRYLEGLKFRYLLIFALSCCVGFYSYLFLMGMSYLLFLFISALFFYHKQLLEKICKLKSVPFWHFIVFAGLLAIFFLPEIFMGLTFTGKQVSLQSFNDVAVTENYELIYKRFPTRNILELVSPRMWVTLFTGTYLPDNITMLVHYVGAVSFPFLILSLFSFKRIVWCVAFSGLLIGLLANNLFPANLLYAAPGLRYLRNYHFYGQFLVFTIIILAGFGFHYFMSNRDAYSKKVLNISAFFLFLINLFLLLFSKYCFHEYNNYNITALLIASVSMSLIIFCVNGFSVRIAKMFVIGIVCVVVLFSYMFINTIPTIPGGACHSIDLSRLRCRTDHAMKFSYKRQDEDNLDVPLSSLWDEDFLDSKSTSLLSLEDNSYKSRNTGHASGFYGSFKRYHLFIRLPGYEQVMRKKFFFFDRCFVSEEPKDMMAFKRDPELFTSVLARNIGIVDSIENDFGKVSAGKFKPESVSNIPVAGVGDSFAADVKEYNANNIKITVKTNNEGLFTYTDLWDDGWHVRLDGKNAPLKKVFHTFKGVFLTPGVHEVEFFYRSRTLVSILVMNVAFAMCFLGLIAYLLLNLRKKFHTVC